MRRLLYPLAILSTWVHECAHGLAALAVGGSVQKLQVFADGSGLASIRVPNHRGRRVLVYSAGYMGTAAFGSGLLLLRHSHLSDRLLIALESMVLFTVVLWVRNAFGVIVLVLMGASLVTAGLKLPDHMMSLTFTVVASAISMNALTSLKHRYGSGATVGGKPMITDAEAVSAALWLPPRVWWTLWLCGSLVMVFGSIYAVAEAPDHGARPFPWSRAAITPTKATVDEHISDFGKRLVRRAQW